MKLADYLLYQLHENFTTLQDDDGDVPSDYEEFDEYLDEKNFKDLKRYHLDSLDALNDRIDQIKTKLAKRNENETKAQEKEADSDEAAKALLVLLGQAARKSDQNIAFDINGFTNVKLITTVGRNALYVTLRDLSSNNVIAEASYKMSRNSLATRYYDFEKKLFSDWVAFNVDPDWLRDCYDQAYDLKQRLTEFMQNSDEPVLVNEFIAGYFGTDDMESKLETKDDSKKQVVNNGTNQDWNDVNTSDDDDCEDDDDLYDDDDLDDDDDEY